jgi:hypothetical protein
MSSNTTKPNVLVIHEYYEPAKLAGGPVVSIQRLIEWMSDEFVLYVFTSTKDLDGSALTVQTNTWVKRNSACVHYGSWNIFTLVKLCRSLRPEIIYINGMFSVLGTFGTVLLHRLGLVSAKLVICPRGMLMGQALRIKPLRKRLYLKLLLSTLSKSVTWHFTSVQEKSESLRILKGPRYSLIANFPNEVVTRKESYEIEGPLKLLSICLIGPMKNIHCVLLSLMGVSVPVCYSIYGPVTDQVYWERCLAQIDLLPDCVEVNYRGVVNADKITAIMVDNDLFIQPSQSENFGHTLFDALQVGLPIITSHNTPWNELDEFNAGYNIDPQDAETIAVNIEGYLDLAANQRKLKGLAAIDYASARIDLVELTKDYRELFT